MEHVMFPVKYSYQGSKRMYHTDGTITLNKDFVYFKGCNGVSAINRIQNDIGLEDNACKVYMVLITGNIGYFVDVRFGCLIEHFFRYNFSKSFSPRVRIIDLHPVVYLEMTEWIEAIFPEVPKECRPHRVLATVSHKGTVIFRLSWKGVLWTASVEEKIMCFCQWILDCIKDLC
jgi:hypothetical protein